MEIVAKLNSVTKQFGKITALNSLSLEVKKGQAIALLGPNGAGKSTALSILQGLRQPSSGTAQLFGLSAGSKDAMQYVGVTPQTSDFPPQLTPVELLEFAVAHYKNPAKIKDLVEQFSFGEIANRQLRGFSGGEKRKVALALCFAGNPKLLILDEPTAGLDSKGQKHFQKIAKDYVKQGGSVILTSHYWQEIEYIADSIIMIDKGKTILSGKIDEIKSAVGLSLISFTCQNPSDFVTKSFNYSDGKWSAISDKADELVVKLVKNNEQFSSLNINPIALDEALNIYRAKQTNQTKELT